MNRSIKNIIRIVISLTFISTLGGCNITKGLYHLNTKKVKVYQKNYGLKKLKFIPNHHAGRLEFYQNLKDSIISYKQKGYVVFYEGVKSGDKNMNVASKDSLIRKLRKVLGLLPTTEYYSMLDSIPGFISQPSNKNLGIDSTDYNADITINQFVKHYEKLFGTIMLEQYDFEIALEEAYKKKQMKHVDEVAIDFRNNQLASDIFHSKKNKILIIYGAIHRKGLFKELDLLYKIKQ